MLNIAVKVLELPAIPVIVTDELLARIDVAIGNVVEVAFAGTVTVAGTVAIELLDDK